MSSRASALALFALFAVPLTPSPFVEDNASVQEAPQEVVEASSDEAGTSAAAGLLALVLAFVVVAGVVSVRVARRRR